MSTTDIDMDAILAKRREETGTEGDEFGFSLFGQRWTMKDPLFADDAWKHGLADLDDVDIDVAAYYMGDEQYDRFVAAGGSAGIALMALGEHMRKHQDATPDGRPTRRSTSSGRTRRR